MLVRGELACRRQLLERVYLETAFIVLEVIENLRLTDHEPAVDPALSNLRFFCEVNHHAVSVKDQTTKASRRSDGRYGCNPPVRAMKFKQFVQIHVAHAVAVCDHESLVLKL